MATVRKHAWSTAKGEPREAWVVSYGHKGRQRIRTFATQESAVGWHYEQFVRPRDPKLVTADREILIEHLYRVWELTRPLPVGRKRGLTYSERRVIAEVASAALRKVDASWLRDEL